LARGEYIAIHHSDDVWESDKLDRQILHLKENPDTGAVFTNAAAIGQNGEPFANSAHRYCTIFDQPNRTRYEWLRYFFYFGNVLCHPSVLIRKTCYDTLGCYRQGLYQLGDFDMWVRLCLKHDIHVLPQKLTKFRIRPDNGNMSGDTSAARVRL